MLDINEIKYINKSKENGEKFMKHQPTEKICVYCNEEVRKQLHMFLKHLQYSLTNKPAVNVVINSDRYTFEGDKHVISSVVCHEISKKQNILEEDDD